ncbi:MAG: PfkB family carbohydrate kinase [candidate division KSB1 bacterium]|jgi:rfaE bifunctional protein kinase chain/domain|nr:PfkB family carbohydrate kinase [candidate division KSB1 bacterium]
MQVDRIKSILEEIRNVRIGVCGDFCLDAYWIMDARGGELSAETGLQSEAVKKHYYTLGGASNVVANLAALNPQGIYVVGVLGKDIYAAELMRQFNELGVHTGSLIIQEKDFNTVTFAKRILDGVELNRIDFGFFNKRHPETDDQIIRYLTDILESTDALIFNQQVPNSLSERFIDKLNALFEKYSSKIILLDSRHYGDKIRHIYRKTNEIEAAQLNEDDLDPDTVFSSEDVRRYAQQLFSQFHKPVFITRGEKGLVTIDGQDFHEIPGIKLSGKLDTVGAGDTIISALGLCLGAGLNVQEAAEFANLASAVTVQKLYMTGTASGDEITELSKSVL